MITGHGISKRTWAASDPVQCFNWFSKYLPVEEERDTCPNHQCTCAVQGRVHTTLANGGVGFGIHSIQCTQHPYGDISVKDMEDRLQAKYGDFSKYDAFMDDNMAFWANNLDNYAHAFQVLKLLKLLVLLYPCNYIVIYFREMVFHL